MAKKVTHGPVSGGLPDCHVSALEHGGYAVFGSRLREREFGGMFFPIAAFSTLPEALAWLEQNVARPVEAADAQRARGAVSRS